MLCLCCVGISLLPAGRDREGISRVWLSPVFKNVFIRINFAFDFKKNVFPFTRFDFYTRKSESMEVNLRKSKRDLTVK